MRRVLLAATAATALLAVPALAHQTASSNGARVTLHVNPDDAPEAGVATAIRVIKVAVPRRASFTYRKCRCRLKITNSAGRVLADRRMNTRATFTFPSAGAYRLTYSGRYRRSGRTKKFAASFAIRAS